MLEDAAKSLGQMLSPRLRAVLWKEYLPDVPYARVC